MARHRIQLLGLPQPPHIWLGVSVEDQERADNRIQVLLNIPAQVRFLSCEPLLGPLDVDPYLEGGGIAWVIDGGESGPGRRPADTDWFRVVRDACLKYGVPYFHKQGNDLYPGRDRELDGVTWDQVPSQPRGLAGLDGVWSHLGVTDADVEASKLKLGAAEEK